MPARRPSIHRRAITLGGREEAGSPWIGRGIGGRPGVEDRTPFSSLPRRSERTDVKDRFSTDPTLFEALLFCFRRSRRESGPGGRFGVDIGFERIDRTRSVPPRPFASAPPIGEGRTAVTRIPSRSSSGRGEWPTLPDVDARRASSRISDSDVSDKVAFPNPSLRRSRSLRVPRDSGTHLVVNERTESLSFDSADRGRLRRNQRFTAPYRRIVRC